MNVIERALELARDGRHRCLSDIRNTLTREGYDQVHAHLHGASIRATIAAVIKSTKLNHDTGPKRPPFRINKLNA